MYKTLLHRINNSPSAPFNLPFWYSSAFASCRWQKRQRKYRERKTYGIG